MLRRGLALGNRLAGGVRDNALGDLRDGLAGGGVVDGGKTAREDSRAEGYVVVVSRAQWRVSLVY